jgi:hypothetical protein
VLRRALLGGVALLLVSACGESSNLDRDAAVTVQGTLHDVDGAPLASRPVRLGSGVSGLEGGSGFLTVGLFCLSGECSGDFFDARSDDDGSFAFELTGADTQSTFGEAVSFLLSASGEPRGEHPTGPAVAARFRIQTDQLSLPDLQLVDPDLRIEARGASVSATWDDAAPAPYTVGFATPDGLPVWEVTAAERAATVDGRVLEDVTGLVTVGGSRTDAIEGSELAVTWRSSGVAFRGGFGAPPSRGGSCELRSSDGAVVEVDECGLADGSMQPAGLVGTVCAEPTAETPSPPCAPAERVRLRLPEAIPADLLVVRGCTDPCRAAVVGAPGGAVTDVGPISGAFDTVVLGGAPVTAIEVITEDVSSLVEVSAWAPATPGPALLPVDDPTDVLQDTDRAGKDRRWVAAVAVGLIVAVVLVLGRVRGTLRIR